MAAKTDLRDTIISVSRELFMKHSYAATSIKQIAKAADCTTAALYYYFEDGKEGILREVLEETMPDLEGFLEPLQDVTSLHELSLELGMALLSQGQEVLKRTRWMMVELPNMSQEERARLHQKLIRFQQGLADLMAPFLENRQEAEMLAWVQFAALFGYGQLFVTLDLVASHEPLGSDFIRAVADLIGQRGKGSS